MADCLSVRGARRATRLLRCLLPARGIPGQTWRVARGQSGVVCVELDWTEIHDAGTILQMPEGSQVTDLWSYSTQVPDSDKGLGILLQYVGSSRAPFFRFMARH